MNFRLTKLKVILSLIVIIVFYALMYFVLVNNTFCDICPSSCTPCKEVFHVAIIPEPCNCPCVCDIPTTFLRVLGELLVVLAPGILVYIIWSLFQKKSVKKRK